MNNRKTAMTLLLLLAAVLLLFPFSPAALADTGDSPINFPAFTEQYGAVMLWVDPQTGLILYANKAADAYYGYGDGELESMSVYQLTHASTAEVNHVLQDGISRKQNHFVFDQLLASGEVRKAELYAYPITYQDTEALFFMIHDVQDSTLLAKKSAILFTALILVSAACFILLLLFCIVLIIHHKKLKIRNRGVEDVNAMLKTFFDTSDNFIYLKDGNLKYRFFNRALESHHQQKADDIIGTVDADFLDAKLAEKIRRTDLLVLKSKQAIHEEAEWGGHIYNVEKFPVNMPNGNVGVGANIKDITKEKEREKQRESTLRRNDILINILNRNYADRQEQLTYVLNESMKLTGSEFGYIYTYDGYTNTFLLDSLSESARRACKLGTDANVFHSGTMAIWKELVGRHKAIVINDYQMPNPLKSGYPTDHISIKRFLAIPILMDKKLVAIMGFANKASEYDDQDIYEVSVLMSGAWNSLERKAAQDILIYERNKYLQTLISIGEGVMIIDQNQKVEMLNKVAEKLTGWTLEEARGRSYREVLALTDESGAFLDPIAQVFQTDSAQDLEKQVILHAQGGVKYAVEENATPIKDHTQNTIGVVLVFRDVTEKNAQSKKIEYLSFHDILTGLYNRRFFEEELNRLDMKANLPICVLMGDTNGLKLINDIFGHSYGDQLLMALAEVMQHVCGSHALIARWGGDEFIVLLMNTTLEEGEALKKRVKEEFSRKQFRAIRGSVSIGCAVKADPYTFIKEVLEDAEEKMYLEKTLERNDFRISAIESIISHLYANSPREKEHAIAVSRISEALGAALGLAKDDIRKLKDAGYLHDIGKTTLDHTLLNKNHKLNYQEWSEMKKHPMAGYRILNAFEDTLELADIVLAHHEHWDGTGYPKGLRGEEIPLPARIIYCSESYDSMRKGYTTNQPMSKAQAIEEIRKGLGTRYDPHISQVFIQMLQEEKTDPYDPPKEPV